MDLEKHYKTCTAAKIAMKNKPKGTGKSAAAKGVSDERPAYSRTSAAATLTEVTGEYSATLPCAICGRYFSADRLGKHQSICRKVNGTKKRSQSMSLILFFFYIIIL